MDESSSNTYGGLCAIATAQYLTRADVIKLMSSCSLSLVNVKVVPDKA